MRSSGASDGGLGVCPHRKKERRGNSWCWAEAMVEVGLYALRDVIGMM